jgi:Protein of unknown function (DUF4232)
MNLPIGALRRALLLSTLVVLAACNATNTATRNPPGSPGASTPAPSQAAGGPCAPAALSVTGGAWGAAAGSRGADVSVENTGAAACTLPAGPAVAILDGGGAVVLESPAGTDPGPTLDPGAVATFTILVSNWCDETTPLPLHIVLHAEGGSVQVPGLDMTADDLPPCNGPGQPPALSVNPWQVL